MPGAAGSRRVVRVLVGALAAAGTLVVSRQATAQEWLKDRQYQEGAGVQAGDFEFHPGIAAEGGYDSNWFLRTDKAGFANSGPVGSPEMRITPSLTLSTMGAQRAEGKTGRGRSRSVRASQARTRSSSASSRPSSET